MLTPNPTPQQTEQVRKIVNVTSTAEVIERMNSYLTDSAWAEIILDITEWGKLKNKHNKIDGDGVKIDKNDNRLDIRNRVRVALGYPEVDIYGDVIGCGFTFFPSSTVSKKVGW